MDLVAPTATSAPDHFQTTVARRSANEVGRSILSYDRGLGPSAAALKDRWKNTASSPSSFLRANPKTFHDGVVGAFASDVALVARPAPRMLVDNDAHFDQYSAYATRGGGVRWGLVDFDTAAPGSPEWDHGRNAVHAVLLAREQGHPRAAQRKLAEAFAASYFGEIERLASLRRGSALPGGLSINEASEDVRRVLQRAGNVRRADFLAKWVDLSDGRFKSSPWVEALPVERRAVLEQGLVEYASRLPRDLPIAVPLRILDVVAKAGSGGSTLLRELEPQKQRVDASCYTKLSSLDALARQAAVALARSHVHSAGNARALQAWAAPDGVAGGQCLAQFALTYATRTTAYQQAFAVLAEP